MRAYTFRKSSVAIAFCVLMVLMTQTGYLDNLNPWSGNQETLDQITEAMETGGSSSSNSNLTASVEGANLFIDESMSNITFLYDDGAANIHQRRLSSAHASEPHGWSKTSTQVAMAFSIHCIPLVTPSISDALMGPTEWNLEERWNDLRDDDGQGYGTRTAVIFGTVRGRQPKHQQHTLFRCQRWNQRI